MEYRHVSQDRFYITWTGVLFKAISDPQLEDSIVCVSLAVLRFVPLSYVLWSAMDHVIVNIFFNLLQQQAAANLCFAALSVQ